MLGKSRVIVNEKILELAMSISNSNVLPRTSMPELMALFDGLLGQRKNNLIKPLEDDNDHKGATKVNAWIDSMRASSPTRTRHDSENRDQTHWTVSLITYTHTQNKSLFDYDSKVCRSHLSVLQGRQM